MIEDATKNTKTLSELYEGYVVDLNGNIWCTIKTLSHDRARNKLDALVTLIGADKIEDACITKITTERISETWR